MAGGEWGAFGGATPFRPPEGYVPPQPAGASPSGQKVQEQTVRHRLYGPIEGDPECPVVPLGKDKETLYLLSPGGEIMCLTAKANANAFVTLFDGDVSWLIQHFRKVDKDGEPVRDFVMRNAWAWFVAKCRAAGIWDPATRTRGVGVWRGPVGKDGVPVPVVHCGDAIYEAPPHPPARALQDAPDPGARGGGCVEGSSDALGRWHREGWRHDKAIYVARPALARPAIGAPATAKDGRRVLEALHLWHWSCPYDPDLCAGWFAAAQLGGYPSWRVHVQLAAEFGSGKTTLMKLLTAGLGCLGKEFNDVTEAGARAALANEGRVLIVDEAENEGGPDGKVARLIGLLRRMAGDDGASVGRSSPGQQLYETHVSGCALMAAILPPALQPADRSRIWRGTIKKITGGDPDKLKRIETEIEWMRATADAFRARMLLNWRRFADAQKAFRSHLIGRAGADGRQADLLSLLLAGRDVLLHDHPPTADEIEEAVDMVGGLLGLMRQADSESSTAQQCWNYLLSWDTPDRRGGEVQNLGRMLGLALGGETLKGHSAHNLPRFGLRLMEVTREMADRYPNLSPGDVWLLVANQHGGLSRIFSGTHGSRWAAGNWNVSLAQLGDDVITWPVPVQFAGAKSRSIAIPMIRGRVLSEHAPEPVELSSVPPSGGGYGSQGGLV